MILTMYIYRIYPSLACRHIYGNHAYNEVMWTLALSASNFAAGQEIYNIGPLPLVSWKCIVHVCHEVLCTCLYISGMFSVNLHSNRVTLSSLLNFNFSVMHPHTFAPHTLMSSIHFLHRYYKGVDGAVLVYDMTNRKSFEKVDMWLKELQEQVDSNIVIMLFGKKCDLPRPRAVPTDKAKAYAEENSMMFYETSAKDGTNVEEALCKFLTGQ